MADVPVSIAEWAGFLKTNYASALVDTIPEEYVLQTDARFGRKLGEQFHQAVVTQWEQGGTYAKAGAGPFALEEEVAGTIDKALVDGFQFVLRSGIDYETLAKAVAKGKLAYGSSGDQLLRNMAQSTRKRLEISLWAGQSPDGLGVVESVNGQDIVITPATWASGYYIGMEKVKLEFFDSTLATPRVAGTAFAVLKSVNPTTRTLTMDSVASALPTDVVATDRVFFKTQHVASSPNDMLGLIAIAKTATGTLFNIDVTTSSIWKPNSFAVGGQLTFSKIQQAVIHSVVKGLMSGAKVYVSIEAWADLLTEQAALRRYGGEFDGRVKLVNGGKEIEFWSSTGRLTIKPTFYCPRGLAIICPSRKLVRVGATDVTFRVPGFDEPNIHISDSTAGVSLRSYYHQSLFIDCPGQITVLTGITTSAA